MDLPNFTCNASKFSWIVTPHTSICKDFREYWVYNKTRKGQSRDWWQWQWWWWWLQWWFWQEVHFLGYVVSSHIVLIFRCSSGSHLTLMLRTSLSTDPLICAAQIVVEFDVVDAGGDGDGKPVKKSSKSQKSVKKTKKPQRPEKLQRSSIWRNFY